MREIISNHLNSYDLDIRKSGDARFMDQKCTPDVVCFIADCIMNVVTDPKGAFAVSDIWNSPYFVKNARAIFNKPIPTNRAARHEYDKFIQQPLRMLAYAHVLEMEKEDRCNFYRIANEEILEYISTRERNSCVFLYCYFEKVLKDSGVWRFFERFIKCCSQGVATNAEYIELRDRYVRFIIGNTRVNTDVEVRRMFPKVLNVIAVENGIQGSERGRITKHAFSFSDLMYNRKNWRDMNKDKGITRQEAASEADVEQQEHFNQYQIHKAMALLRKIQIESEVHDQWANGEATQIHHIFPKSQFPQIAYYIENLVKLTATQHFTKAHPGNHTQAINRDYQLTCLLSKAATIDKSLKMYGEKYYRKESFIHVINVGLSAELNTTLSFADIKTALIHIYNAA